MVRIGEFVHVDFKLGNCNDGRRDFSTSGLIDPKGVWTGVMPPSQTTMERLDKFVRSARSGSEGYWSHDLMIRENGMSWIAQTLDQIIEHDGVKMRGIVTAKAFVIGSESLDQVRAKIDNEVLDLPFELVLESSPLPSLENADSIRVQLLRDSMPQRSVRVSFLPQQIDHEHEEDSLFERETDAKGMAEFKPDRSGLYLITARMVKNNSNASGPKEIYYSTSLTLRVTNRSLGPTTKNHSFTESKSERE
jgi:uncharacterized GH25 family protein